MPPKKDKAEAQALAAKVLVEALIKDIKVKSGDVIGIKEAEGTVGAKLGYTFHFNGKDYGLSIGHGKNGKPLQPGTEVVACFGIEGNKKPETPLGKIVHVNYQAGTVPGDGFQYSLIEFYMNPTNETEVQVAGFPDNLGTDNPLEVQLLSCSTPTYVMQLVKPKGKRPFALAQDAEGDKDPYKNDCAGDAVIATPEHKGQGAEDKCISVYGLYQGSAKAKDGTIYLLITPLKDALQDAQQWLKEVKRGELQQIVEKHQKETGDVQETTQ
eukprot:TRINITY_DN40897_c0_g1_i1.p1 TRINITY_DN40897_c0_g1~~TRINITY_DN40897_c0_g1_i1.p1  ORF type:complete len:269 (-),score=44.08 TRINITY_DN40897_c0_g1_i1:100-906(-)